MDTVLIALLVLMMLLHGVMTVARGWMLGQEMTAEAWADMTTRTSARASTGLRVADVQVLGSLGTLTVQNSGESKLADFDRWDVILHCYTASGQYRISRLTFAVGAPPGEGWAVEGLYLDASEGIAEVYEPGVLNPGEEVVILAYLAAPLEEGATHMVVVGTSNGATSTRQFATTP